MKLSKIILVCAYLLEINLTAGADSACAFYLPDTGQTKCYQSIDPYAEIPCTGTGQDGAYNINPMAYTDSGSGTVTDNVTKLIWQKEEQSLGLVQWAEAAAYCDGLTLGGYSDWRLPSKKELMSLVNYGISWPDATINTTFFPNPLSPDYSSTIYAPSPESAWWCVDFYGGFVVDCDDTGGVRCVRGGQLNFGIFTDNGNGTVTETGTGLMWQQGEAEAMTWDSALAYCEGLSLAGYGDWRLPNIRELGSLTDDTLYDPAINAGFSLNATETYYWSSTTDAFWPDYAWYVDFYDGSVNSGGKAYDVAVRCVRGGRSNCAATLSADYKAHVPIGIYNGKPYSADFLWSGGDSVILTNLTPLSDTSAFVNCAPSIVSSSLMLHVPEIIFNGVSYWADVQCNMAGSPFKLTGVGRNQ